MPEEEIDRRAEILLKETCGIFDEHEGGITGIFNAMDVHATEVAISFLKYVLEKMGGHSVDTSGNVEVKYNGEWITPEQLFENFL